MHSNFREMVLDFMPAVYIADDLLPLLNRHAMIREIPVIPLVRYLCREI